VTKDGCSQDNWNKLFDCDGEKFKIDQPFQMEPLSIPEGPTTDASENMIKSGLIMWQ